MCFKPKSAVFEMTQSQSHFILLLFPHHLKSLKILKRKINWRPVQREERKIYKKKNLSREGMQYERFGLVSCLSGVRGKVQYGV